MYYIFNHETQQALAKLYKHRISSVMFEFSAPDEQDWLLLAAIKSLPGDSPIPVILSSILDEHKRGMEMGVAAYLIKPGLPTTLRERLRQGTRRC